MAALHPFAGLDGDHLQPWLAGAVARPARPVPAPATLRRVEPLAAVFLGLHGVMVLANLGGVPWQWAGVGLVLLLGLVSLGGRGPSWMVLVRAGTILAVGVALQASAGGAGGWFVAWPFVLVAVYPLALPGRPGWWWPGWPCSATCWSCAWPAWPWRWARATRSPARPPSPPATTA